MIDHDTALCRELAGGWRLMLFSADAGVDAWLMRDLRRGELYEHHFTDTTPLDLEALDVTPAVRCDYAERPYLVWPCGHSALIWRCAQEQELWASPASRWPEPRAP